VVRKALWLCIAFGIALRFYGLGNKLYWYDEVISSLRVSGITEAEATAAFAGSGSADRESFLQFQRPRSDRGAADVVRGLAVEEPQHPPLYFLALRSWMQIFGESPAAARAPSALASALMLLAFAWLCFELEFREGALIGCALLAVSPFQILYAQEAREIAPVMLFTLITSALLARALRRGKGFALYGFALLCFLYISLFSLMVVVAHAIFVAFAERFRPSRNSQRYLATSAIAGACLLPWANQFRLHYATSQLNQRTTIWMWERLSHRALLERWLGNLARTFFDFSTTGFVGERTTLRLLLLGLLPVALCGWSLVELWRRRRERYAQLALALIVAVILVLFLPNFLGSGAHSTRTRYLCTFYLGLTLSIALLLAKPRWTPVLFAALALGAISCAISAPRPLGRNVDYGGEAVETARLIAQEPQALLAIDVRGATFATATSLARELPPDRKILLPASADDLRDLSPAGALVYGPSPELLAALRARFEVKLEQEASYYKLRLWRITRR
jgi:uncharacterized membrane protein